MFGPSLLVAPVVTEMDNATQMASKDIWIPNVCCHVTELSFDDFLFVGDLCFLV